jgi:HlyD family secretion protein
MGSQGSCRNSREVEAADCRASASHGNPVCLVTSPPVSACPWSLEGAHLRARQAALPVDHEAMTAVNHGLWTNAARRKDRNVTTETLPAELLSATATSPAAHAPQATEQLPKKKLKALIIWGAIIVVSVGAVLVWFALRPVGLGAGFISGNGRIEATEIDVATKLAGRVQDIMVKEGDFVVAGQPLAQMQIDVLDAQRDEARAQSRRAVNSVSGAEAQVSARVSDTAAAEAMVEQRKSELDAAHRRLDRNEPLAQSGAISPQALDDERARVRGAAAAVNAVQAQLAATQAAVKAAQAQVLGAGSAVAATNATVDRVEADIQDSQLKSPRDGRVQYRIAQPGEVLPGGGKVLNLVDLSDVYMTFFLPEAAAGKLALGSEVHIVLDAAPQYVLPARVSYVASTAQFTPKTVETASERQKLMFRVKAQFDRTLLQKHLSVVKTGLPGLAWIKLDAQDKWPAQLALKVPE